ncbi:MAG: elongation factor P--(R)-beta-lysine ligase [Spirochaetia bacterium]|jgi:lysyl-tRNA synthetase class 2|nr:elongation factor P--(R)-beta-lysine ligase [Spirochaetia bacterium]
MNIDIITKRSHIIGQIRSFFQTNEYVEVETPILAPELIPESTIEVFETTFSSEFHGDHQFYLIPSPEVFMKKLISKGSGNIYQITKSFRNSEQIGKDHNPEFTMLEWYTIKANYLDSIKTIEDLFISLTDKNTPSYFKTPFIKKSIEEVFKEYISIDLLKCQTRTLIKKEAQELGLTIEKTDTWEDIFNRIFLNFIEPELPCENPVVLYNYPKQIVCLAKELKGTPWRERWELYVNGIELANCYSEETDSSSVKNILESEYIKKASSGRVIPDIDSDYYLIFNKDFPECSGVALGIDRLVMLLTGTSSIEGVILFPFSDTVKQIKITEDLLI